MPHVTVKLLSGRSEEQKSEIAAAVTKAVMASAKCTERTAFFAWRRGAQASPRGLRRGGAAPVSEKRVGLSRSSCRQDYGR
jgi:Tautomerase enzyme